MCSYLLLDIVAIVVVLLIFKSVDYMPSTVK